MKREDRMLGGLLGAVVGDALGVPVEFSSREQRIADPVTDMRGHGTHDQPPGTWSDDSSMALCLAESIVRSGWSVKDQAARYLRWAFENYMTPHGRMFDIGGTTRQALQRYRDGSPLQASGGRDEWDNGNGALMRMLPAAVYFARASDEMLRCALDAASSVTHAHPRSRLASVYFGLLVSELLHSVHARDAMRAANARLEAICPHVHEFAVERESLSRILDQSLFELPEREIRSGGYVIDTLEAALWCLLRSSSYEECVLKSVNLGGDTDTTATVAGGLAGLVWGVDAIPAHWIDALARREELETLARALVECCSRPVNPICSRTTNC